MSLARIERISFGVAAVMVLISALWLNWRITLSVLGGAAISIGSFAVLRFTMGQALARTGGLRVAFVLAAFLKLAALGFILWLVVRYLPINPWGFITGLSAILVSIMLESAYIYRLGDG